MVRTFGAQRHVRYHEKGVLEQSRGSVANACDVRAMPAVIRPEQRPSRAPLDRNRECIAGMVEVPLQPANEERVRRN